METRQSSDQETMRDGYDSEGWFLRLTALSADDPQRLVRFLTGVLLGCGGWILTRTTEGDDLAVLDFEFARASCVEIYAALIASGLELSQDSHLRMAELCHCTRNLIQSKAFDVARIDLVIYSDKAKCSREGDATLRMAS
jgi:hypothetical protein